MLTPLVELVEIPAVPDALGNRWKIRALSIGGKSPALSALVEWEASEAHNFKKIVTALKMAAREKRCTNPRYVKKGQNKDHGDVYEVIAHSLEARLMFFYSEADDAIVCTNSCWKTSDNQDRAFALCAYSMSVYEKSHASKSTNPKRTR